MMTMRTSASILACNEEADPLVKGMDAQRANDPVYRACLRARLTTDR